MNVKLEAPAFGRTIHPAPPDPITVHEKPFDLVTLDNPYRPLETSDPDGLRRRTSPTAGGSTIENCFYCHGDAMRGDGMFAHGLNPIPTNFADAGAIALLQESFLFWRIAKGGPGLPEEGGPWDTAMPAWEKFLTEEEMWDVDPLPLRLLRPAAARARGGARSEPAERTRSSAGCAAARWLDRLVAARRPVAPRGRAGRAPPGGRALPEALLAVPRREGRRQGHRGAAPPAAAARLHRRQVQGPHDAERRAARPTTTCSTSSARACPTPRCRAGATCPTPRSTSWSPHVKTFSPDFAEPGEDAGRRSPSRRRRASRAESAAKGKEVYAQIGCARLPRRARARRRHLGADADRRLGPPDPPRRPAEALDLPRRADARGHLPHLHHRHERHADAVVRRVAHRRGALAAGRLHRDLDPRATTPGYAELVQVAVPRRGARPRPRRRASSSPTAPAAHFPVVGQIIEPGRAFHPSANGVDGAGGLQPREIAFLLTWHDMRADAARHERARPRRCRPRRTQGAGRAAARGRARPRGGFWGEEEPAPPSCAGCRGRRASGGDFWGEESAEPRRRRPAAGVLRRGRDPAPGRSCRPASASRTSSSATPRTRSTSGSSTWRPEARARATPAAGSADRHAGRRRGRRPRSRATTRASGR